MVLEVKVMRNVLVRLKCGVSVLVRTKELTDEEVSDLIAYTTRDRIVEVRRVPLNELPLVDKRLYFDTPSRVQFARRRMAHTKILNLQNTTQHNEKSK